MTVAEAIVEAVRDKDAVKAGRCADKLRSMGLTYAKVYACAKRLTGISAAEWETLMEAADRAEAGDPPPARGRERR